MRQPFCRSPTGRRWRQWFAATVIAVGAGASASAATIAVTATADDVSSNGNCTLREAIIAANTNVAVDACAAGAGFDLVTVPAGTYTLAIAGVAENAGATGDLTIRGDANGLTIIDGGALDTVIEVDPNKVGLSVTLIGLAIRNGQTPAAGDRLEFAGGGIRNFSSLTLHDVTVSNNTASVGGGIFAGCTL